MKPILPGAVIGLLGGGQLGRMFAISARKMGYRVHTYEPSPDSPTGQISDVEVNSPYSDTDALVKFAREVDVLTYEFENIPVQALDVLADVVPLRPGRDVLFISQNRRREKEFLQKNGFPVAPFRVVNNPSELAEAIQTIGCPCVLKTADFGYDGKGQQKITGAVDPAEVWKKLDAPVGVVEKWISFEHELSVIVARSPQGVVSVFPVARNHHENHILATTHVPSGFPPEVEKKAIELASEIARAIQLVGILAVEMFLTKDGNILVNEMAPRPHNSGHFSFDACLTSQFEQQLRAVCGLPLGNPALLKPVIMRNLLGDLWAKGTPPWAELLAIPELKLHLYGKSEPRRGRKMGHYCVLGDTLQEAEVIEAKAWSLLKI